jgi:hypothetical protein
VDCAFHRFYRGALYRIVRPAADDLFITQWPNERRDDGREEVAGVDRPYSQLSLDVLQLCSRAEGR